MSPERLCSLLFWSQAQDFLLPGLSSFSHSFHTPKCPSWLNSLVSGPQSFSDSPGLGQSYSHGDFRFSRTLCWAPSEPLCCGTEGTWWSSALTTGQMNRGHLCWRLAQGASQAAQWSKKKKKKNLLVDTGDTGSVPWVGRSPGRETGNPLQYSCLENSIDRGTRRATSTGSQRVGHD